MPVPVGRWSVIVCSWRCGLWAEMCVQGPGKGVMSPAPATPLPDQSRCNPGDTRRPDSVVYWELGKITGCVFYVL